MINISKSGNAIKFVFTDNDHYLYGSGEIEVPVNSLSLIVDESKMVTFRKANSNDIFLSFDPANSNLSDKAGVINFYKTDMVGSTGGGGSESGITSGEVQTMIDESISGKADTAVVNQIANEAAQAILSVSGDVQTISANTNNLAWVNFPENNDKLSNLFDQYTSGNSWNIPLKSQTDAALSGKADTSAVTAVANDVTALSGDVTDKQDALQYYSEDAENKSAQIEIENTDLTSTTIFDYSQVDLSVAKVISDVQYNVYTNISDGGVSMAYDKSTGDDATDAHSYLDVNDNGISAEVYANEETTTFAVSNSSVTINGDAVATEPYVDAAISGKVETSAITSAITSASTNDEVAGAKAVYDAIQAGGGSSVTVDSALDSGSTNPVANSAITAGIDDAKAYFISFATIATTGIHDADWDGIVAAIDDHRPIYAGYPRSDGGIIYYGVECMNKNVGNTEIVMTTSDNENHYFYTFTKNGSNDYSYTVSTKPYVPEIATAVTSASTDTEIPTAKATYDAIQAGGGGGATYSAGTNIEIDTANTINCTLPITVASNGSFKFGSSITSNLYNGEFLIGRGINSTAASTRAFGDYLNLNSNNETAFGYCNLSRNNGNTSGTTLLTVGNGSSNYDRKNAFEIRQNNDIYIRTGYGANDMVRLQDMYAALGGLKLVKLTQAEYDALATKDNDTLYIISNVVS